MFCLAVPAHAQVTADEPRPRLIISERAIAAALAEHPPVQPPSSRDSVANGALLGGFLVGSVLAIGGGLLCNNLKEEGDPPCWKGIVTVGAVGFAVGAAVGAGLDLLFARSSPQPRTAQARIGSR